MPSAPEAGNTSESLTPKNVLDTLKSDVEAGVKAVENLFTSTATVEEPKPAVPEAVADSVTVFFPAPGTYPVSGIAPAASIEGRLADLENRIAQFNAKSPHKI